MGSDENLKRVKNWLLPILIIGAVSTFLVQIWLQGKILLYIDMYLPLNPPLDIRVYGNVWVNVVGHGEYFGYAINLWYFVSLFYFFFWELGLNVQQIEFFQLWLYLFSSGTGMYVLSRKLCKTMKIHGNQEVLQYIPYVSALFYLNNFYVMTYLLSDGIYAMWIGYSVLPWFAISLLNSVSLDCSKRSLLLWRSSLLIWSSFVFFVATIYVTISIEIVSLSIFLLIFFTLDGKIHGSRKSLVVELLFFVGLILCFNIWQLKPIFDFVSVNTSIYTSAGLYSNVLNSILNFNSFPVYRSVAFPTFPSGTSFTNPLGNSLAFLSYFVTLTAVAPLLKKNSTIERTYIATILLFLFTIAILSVEKGPLGFLFIAFAFRGSPLFLFQNVGATVGLISTFSSTLCITYGSYTLADYLFIHLRPKTSDNHIDSSLASCRQLCISIKKIRSRVIPSSVFLVSLIIVLLISTQSLSWSPYAISSTAGISATTSFPSYYTSMEIFLEHNTGPHLVLGLPVGAGMMGLYWPNSSSGLMAHSPINSASGVPNVFDGQVTTYDQFMYYRAIYETITYGQTTQFAKLLNFYNIKYVVLQRNFIHQWVGGPEYFNITHILSFLLEQNQLKLVKVFGPELVFENAAVPSFIYAGYPVYFNPSPQHPLGVANISYDNFITSFQNRLLRSVEPYNVLDLLTNESSNSPLGFWNSFLDRAYPLSLPNGTISYLANSNYSNGNLTLSLKYVNSASAGYQSISFPSDYSLGLNASVDNIVVVNYTTYSLNSSLFLTASNVSYGAGPYAFLNAYPSNPNYVGVSSIPLLGTHTIAFQLPSNFPPNLNYITMGITLNNPVNNTNYTIVIHSVKFAQYANYNQITQFVLSYMGTEPLLVTSTPLSLHSSSVIPNISSLLPVFLLPILNVE